MQYSSSVKLSRDCDATQVPAGSLARLPVGTPVEITQTLGGSYTVEALGGLFRIASKDADALGLVPATMDEPLPSTAAGEGLDEGAVWNLLRQCYDPEIPVNIVDLGLIYDLRIEPLPSGKSRVAVKMTLTAPGCGMGPTIAADAQEKLLQLPDVEQASVELVWDPPWQPSMISPTGRAALGLD